MTSMALKFSFGSNPFGTPTLVTPLFALSPASDTGSSSSDGITNLVSPDFLATFYGLITPDGSANLIAGDFIDSKVNGSPHAPHEITGPEEEGASIALPIPAFTGGTHTISIRQRRGGGASNYSTPVVVTIDVMPPNLSSATGTES